MTIVVGRLGVAARLARTLVETSLQLDGDVLFSTGAAPGASKRFGERDDGHGLALIAFQYRHCSHLALPSKTDCSLPTSIEAV